MARPGPRRAARARRWILAAPLVLALVAPPSAAGLPFVLEFGRPGNANGEFYSPTGIDFDADGNVYVSDGGRVQRFSPRGRFLSSFDTMGGAAALAVDPAGDVYVSALFGSIRKFSPTGVLLTGWETYSAVRGIATDFAGNLYVTDYDIRRNRILKFNPDGVLIMEWRLRPLTHAEGVAVDPAGTVYVVGGGGVVYKYSSQGRYLRSWNIGGHTRAYDIAADGNGNVYTADFCGNRVWQHDSQGQLRSRWGSFGKRPGEFYAPSAIGVDPYGYVYVGEHGNFNRLCFGFGDRSEEANRVQKFRPPARAVCRTPAAVTRSRKACFRFAPRRNGVTYQCRLTGAGVPAILGRWVTCGSPRYYEGLRLGRKTFWLRKTEPGQTAAPSSKSWRIRR